ncbi:hypothetical protein K4G93_25475, partial [Mycobacterium tuberculosis]|nr:hypothetical protein [Mycobacterium tuberculosis]
LLTGKDSSRLINVAITRTKGKFIHVSDTQFLREKVYTGKTIIQLLDHQIKEGQTVAHQQIGSWIKNQHPMLRWIHA